MTNTNFENSFTRSSFNTIVDVVVGPDKEVFKIHKELLCERSPFFRAALNGQSKEAHSQTIVLYEDNPTVIEFFQLWVYSGSVLFANQSPSAMSWYTLYDLYKFGDKHEIPRLQNTVIDVFIDKGESIYKDPEIKEQCALLDRIYKELPGECLLKELFVDLLTYNTELMDRNWFENGDFYNKELLLELTRSLYKVNIGKKAKQMDFAKMRSLYHHKLSENDRY